MKYFSEFHFYTHINYDIESDSIAGKKPSHIYHLYLFPKFRLQIIGNVCKEIIL